MAPRGDLADAARPRVSVIVPVWNAEPYLRPAIDSVLRQSIGLDALEIVAVDDGSTDGSGATLDDYAGRHPQVHVVHEPNSGGPGRPRNLGLDRARGEYVFFLDADDELGPEALERMVAMADRNGSDIVLGKMVGVDGRIVPTAAFLEDRERADLVDVYSTLTVLKLFRRALIERLGLRFEEGLAGGEDGLFTARAYLGAGTISVLASYPCYYVRSRPGSQTRRTTREDKVAYLGRIEQRLEAVDRWFRGSRADRERLITRHILDVLRPFRRRWVETPDEERRRVFDAAAALLARWHHPSIQATLSPPEAIRAHCLTHGRYTELIDIVATPDEQAYGRPRVEGGRVFAAWPHFRDGTGIPDRAFELTRYIEPEVRVDALRLEGGRLRIAGLAYLAPLGGAATIELRRWPRGPRIRLDTRTVATPGYRDRLRRYPDAGFEVDVDLATADRGRPPGDGWWRIEATFKVASIVRRRALRMEPPPAPVPTTVGDRPVVLASDDGRLRLQVGQPGLVERAADRVAALTRPLRTAWRRTRRAIRHGFVRRHAGKAWRRLRRRLGRRSPG